VSAPAASDSNVVRIDDLRDPVLDDAQRAAIEYAAGLTFDWDEQSILDAACVRTGLDDFGADDFLPRLRAMVDAVLADDGLGPLGRMIVHQRIVRLLANRLLVEDFVRRYPEVLAIELVAPIVVVGLPRSGTTHLVNLIAADPRRRSLPYWESLEPLPNRGDGPGADGVDPRWLRCRRAYEGQMLTAPLVRAMHHQYPEAIEEEIELLDLDFASYTLEWHARVPRWRDFYLGIDQRPCYAYLRKVLQVLTFLRGPNRWVLKSPQHLEQLDALQATFPDATFAVTHRDPVAVLQSAITMLAYGDRVRRPRVEPEQLAAYWLDRTEALLRSCVRDHDRLPAERTIDVLFHEFMADDLGMVERIYARAGVDVDDRTRARLSRFLADNPRGKHGRVAYDLQGHFGIDPDAARARFDFYFDRFPVRVEQDGP
jgi:hypothetical protein